MREELKGRQAAIQARFAKEIESLDAEIEEIELVERHAQAFAAKHLPANEAVGGRRARLLGDAK